MTHIRIRRPLLTLSASLKHSDITDSVKIIRSSPYDGPEALPAKSDIEMLDLLSPRQMDVFHWICEGKRDREIAVILGISYRTVTVHVRAILAKLGVENRTCAAMMGARARSKVPPVGEMTPHSKLLVAG